jgi:hypothetical protein
MAHALGAAHALAEGLGDLFIPGLGLRMEQTYDLNPRDNSPTENNVVNMFVDGASNGFKLAASVVTACAEYVKNTRSNMGFSADVCTSHSTAK